MTGRADNFSMSDNSQQAAVPSLWENFSREDMEEQVNTGTKASIVEPTMDAGQYEDEIQHKFDDGQATTAAVVEDSGGTLHYNSVDQQPVDQNKCCIVQNVPPDDNNSRLLAAREENDRLKRENAELREQQQLLMNSVECEYLLKVTSSALLGKALNQDLPNEEIYNVMPDSETDWLDSDTEMLDSDTEMLESDYGMLDTVIRMLSSDTSSESDPDFVISDMELPVSDMYNVSGMDFGMNYVDVPDSHICTELDPDSDKNV